jgi:glycosyltransferase involved in cell wall biosynthesis
MRILHILNDRENGRAGNYAVDVILGLHRAGIEQYVVMDTRAMRAPELENAGIKIAPRILHAPGQYLQRLRLRRLAKRTQPHAIQFWMRNSAGLGFRTRIPSLGWLAGPDEPRHFGRCAHFVGAHRATIMKLTKKGVPAALAHFIPAFYPHITAAPADRSALATPRGAKVLLSLAPLHPDSRLDTLLAALRNLTECVAWFAGEGPLRLALEKQARQIGVIDRVRFVSPRVKKSALLRAADICVLGSEDRPLGAIIPQAWAAGTPVIAGYNMGLPAPLRNGIEGLLVPTGDDEGFAEAIRRVLDEDSLRNRLIARGYAAYLGAYTHEAVIRQWIELYRKIAVSY